MPSKKQDYLCKLYLNEKEDIVALHKAATRDLCKKENASDACETSMKQREKLLRKRKINKISKKKSNQRSILSKRFHLFAQSITI